MKWLILPIVIVILITFGYLAACAGAGKLISFTKWLLNKPNESSKD